MFFVSAPLLTGAWLASADHVRILSSQFPLWIILALDGVVAALAGAVTLLVGADDSSDEDGEMVSVPREEWDSLRSRVVVAERSSRSVRPPSFPNSDPRPLRPFPARHR
jgi:hypothetical protein